MENNTQRYLLINTFLKLSILNILMYIVFWGIVYIGILIYIHFFSNGTFLDSPVWFAYDTFLKQTDVAKIGLVVMFLSNLYLVKRMYTDKKAKNTLISGTISLILIGVFLVLSFVNYILGGYILFREQMYFS